ncbi:MAG: Flp family type IVb pilin [Firmicutes bacterium]|nr:Flp family type IVb pilin [Bacillota bacterium]
MYNLLLRLLKDQGGSIYIESALLIIGIAMAVAPFMMSLGATLGGKVEAIKDQVEQVGI